jgi:hypothetical protein
MCVVGAGMWRVATRSQSGCFSGRRFVAERAARSVVVSLWRSHVMFWCGEDVVCVCVGGVRRRRAMMMWGTRRLEVRAGVTLDRLQK